VLSLGDAVLKRTPRERIVQSVLRYSSVECNRLLRRRGRFWQHESYDHWVRDVDELERIMHYVEGNPLKARLAVSPNDYEYSSAYERKRLGLEFGEPLLRPK
jgi:putative transposase